ncbi:GNAT family N-acetyltransferase [Croceiramulus getboli]|nr:GNAT family N-acetyltransferase [Flavobacteriaceae bacterium YJPT1-3]
MRIEEFRPAYAKAFKKLNVQWIRKYFKMETSDYQSLDHPQEYIIDKGGAILVGLEEEQILGVCALIPMAGDDTTMELAKMAVAKEARGRGIGRFLGQAIIEKAIEFGADKLYLESNTVLTPAIHLYRKLGFKEVRGRATPYERCNIQMELKLS